MPSPSVRSILGLGLLMSAVVAAAQPVPPLQVVGHHDLGRQALAADLAVHRGFAYVGQWSYARALGPAVPNGCLETIGVSVVDVRRPQHPELVSVLPAPPFTTVEDIEAFTAAYGPLAGRDIVVSGVQRCGNLGSGGLILWDVSNPAMPSLLAFLETGHHGVHELTVAVRHDLQRTFAFGTVPNGDDSEHGDLRIYDITDPANPAEVSSWGISKDFAVEPSSFNRGCHRATYAHGAETSPDAKLLFVSYWDAGVIILDISDPESPRFIGRTTYEESDEGNAHSADYDAVRKLLFVQDEDLSFFCGSTDPGFGYLRVYDVSDLTAPREIGEFRTPNSRSRTDANYSMHHAVLVGKTLISSWFADGVRVIDVSDPTAPREIASFVPPPFPPPVQPAPELWPSLATRVWGVAVDRATGLIYASDYHSGLWILHRTATGRRRAASSR